MKWESRQKRQSNWHPWFAWYPVWCRDIDRWTWWENVYRIKEFDGWDGTRTFYRHALKG